MRLVGGAELHQWLGVHKDLEPASAFLAGGMSPHESLTNSAHYETVANTKWRIRNKLDLRKTADLIRFYLETRSV